jgi:hypothetical protein
MQGARKIIGVLVLGTFVLVAGSVVCLAAGQPGAMTDCGNQMSGIAMCPFMTVGAPTVTAASLGRELTAILILTFAFVVVSAIIEKDRHEALTLSRYRHSSERPPVSFMNSTIKLISQGVLHSRVFGF